VSSEFTGSYKKKKCSEFIIYILLNVLFIFKTYISELKLAWFEKLNKNKNFTYTSLASLFQ